MTEYSGAKSLDAEITLDFLKKNITMDYTLNEFGNPHNSNTSTIIHDAFQELPFRMKLAESLVSGATLLCGSPLLLLSPFHTFCVEHKIITNPVYHYKYQQVLKYIMIHTRWMAEQSKSGELLEPILTFNLQNNIWFEYELDGEYQDKIKTISLKRRFIKKYLFGKYPREQQVGWSVIFEFTEIPKSGSCILRST
jgi:hypothetical protein